ncbi:MAG: alpha-1,4-glucan--maltose-1-phosphate maltosyltransferase [Syntrophaceae bacterium]|nr:alpha-1,4-glucan--maltose-1-phosphate maltosyltransferase [Syntrophaceae bacterium]
MDEGRKRVVIEAVRPEIDGGRFPVKRVAGETVAVEADVFADGHDLLSARLLYRREGVSQWSEVSMKQGFNDRWKGAFTVEEPGVYSYTVQAWVDRFLSWRQGLAKKVSAGQGVSLDLLTGAEILEGLISQASGEDAVKFEEAVKALRSSAGESGRVDAAMDEELAAAAARSPAKKWATTYQPELRVLVEPVQARFSAWYEMFPRSCSPRKGKSGTFQDCESLLPYIAGMGFDVLYFPPIHPIGRSHRKGKNNRSQAEMSDVGSPWAIGAAEGGHKTVHPELGTLEDFRRLTAKAREHGLEVALDLAFQCTPDHPYVKEHPEWFRRRPDGTIQHAENPPKKYEDVYPFDFTAENWRELWEELKSVVLFWMEQGVRVFRVDNPHTKPFPFWEWLIGEIKKKDPAVIFLSEAFTRPKIMYRLAKLGFSQSYTYFAWRNTKRELEEYFTELTRTEVKEFFRPNLWPNTPDILTEYLQMGGRAAFMARLVLAATLAASYGIYGPAFELCENQPREPGSEEYLDSEKYEIRSWDRNRPDGLAEFIGRVNRIRRENPALQSDRNLQFHSVDNEQLICYSKNTEDLSNLILVLVNLDPHHPHAGWVNLPLTDMGLDPRQPYQVHDLLSGARYLWTGPRNYVAVDPGMAPAQVFRIRRRVRTERDFDYFM